MGFCSGNVEGDFLAVRSGEFFLTFGIEMVIVILDTEKCFRFLHSLMQVNSTTCHPQIKHVTAVSLSEISPFFLAANVDLKAVSLVTVDVTGNPLMPLFLAVWQQVRSHPVNLRPKQVAQFTWSHYADLRSRRLNQNSTNAELSQPWL
ncbi:Uncharacterised protein [Escherichia coli]|nr:Uncharacterised protein [Escherichia coli]